MENTKKMYNKLIKVLKIGDTLTNLENKKISEKKYNKAPKL